MHQAANSLNGMKWNDFRKAQCGSDAIGAIPSQTSSVHLLRSNGTLSQQQRLPTACAVHRGFQAGTSWARARPARRVLSIA
ncbi:hypothetical protein GR257_20450 [Rhizobium leguminosarum]|uniref:Uncharacterized protein n=1 Tax=Rhizobium leguminosarum TaxID=384 RepID=A0A7K3VJC6_RHILE|nr:hypothetical protein [Rhizobium leguminosarum]NEK37317.1 hypothetical protein [Rhizobium leguminosarum]